MMIAQIARTKTPFGRKRRLMTPVCTIIIRTYNEEKHIDRLLTGIMRQNVRDVQIILVDSGSTDSTVYVATHYPVDVVHIHPGEFSFGRSLNLGISSALAENLVFASAHVYPAYPDWLERLLVPLKDSQVALAYGKQRGNEQTKFSEKRVLEHLFPERSQTRQNHPFCNNANAAIRKSLWQ
jgi:rhamnosyltransferase